MSSLIRDAVVLGVFVGFLLCMLVFCGVKLVSKAEPKVCEVNMELQGGTEVHVRYGVVIGHDEGEVR